MEVNYFMSVGKFLEFLEQYLGGNQTICNICNSFKSNT